MVKGPLDCDHDNENPVTYSCSSDCYCRSGLQAPFHLSEEEKKLVLAHREENRKKEEEKKRVLMSWTPFQQLKCTDLACEVYDKAYILALQTFSKECRDFSVTPLSRYKEFFTEMMAIFLGERAMEKIEFEKSRRCDELGRKG